MDVQRGQASVEWVALLLLVSVVAAGLLGLVRVPATNLARAIASRILCATALAESCGDEPLLIATYGTEVGKLVRRHMPSLLFERGSRAVPVDFRRCRSIACGDAAEHGYVRRTDAGLPVSAFVHVVDCRPGAAEASEGNAADCSGERAGNLYIQYWTYYADSATLRDIPIVGEEGFHADDWEGVQIRIRPDGSVDERASSHDGYNYEEGTANWGSDIGVGALKGLAEATGIRPHDGWGPETHMLFVSGGSHAGNAFDVRGIERLTLGSRVHLIPLEPVATTSDARFAINPPWRKKVWRDPEIGDTG
jgi:hypothetical protein